MVRVDADANRIVVGPDEALYNHRLRASKVNYTSGVAPQGPMDVTVKVRYKSHEAPAVLQANGNEALVRFKEAQRALTPGQAVVFYQDDVLVGGGIIEPTPAD